MLKGIGVTTSVFAIESVSADANILIVRSVAWSNDRILESSSDASRPGADTWKVNSSEVDVIRASERARWRAYLDRYGN